MMPVRGRVFILFSIIFLFILFLIFSPSIISLLVKRQLKHSFPQSEVVLERCILQPRGVRLVNFGIKQRDVFSFKTKEFNIEFTLSSLLQKKISKCVIKGGEFSLDINNLRKDSLSQLGLFRIKTVEFSNLSSDLKTKDFELNAYFLSAVLNLEERTINSLDLRIKYFSLPGFKLNDALLEIKEDSAGRVEIKNIACGKLKVENIKGDLQYQKEKMSVSHLSAKFLDGYIEGELNLEKDRGLKYQGILRFFPLNIKRLPQELKLEDKLQLSGLLEGSLIIAGTGFKLDVVKGDFSFLQPGGNLIVKDKNLLRNLAEKTRQSFDIIWEGLRDYYFDKGDLKLFLDNQDLILRLILEGERGKRDLEIRWHNFELGR
ncbi:MAG: hypothetical protein AB7E08_00125 [Candidatus Omnitrophota bacterium]